MKTTESTDIAQAATVAEPGAHVASGRATSKKAANRKRGAPKGRKTAKGARTKKEGKAKKAAAARAEGTAPRAESKGAKILEMIGRAKGATLAEIMKATGWQPHSVRGFISTAGKKHGVKIESARNEKGDRTYQVAK